MYISSPELTSFNSSQGSQGESTIMRRIAIDAPFGSVFHDKGFFELDYAVAACQSMKNIYDSSGELQRTKN